MIAHPEVEWDVAFFPNAETHLDEAMARVNIMFADSDNMLIGYACGSVLAGQRQMSCRAAASRFHLLPPAIADHRRHMLPALASHQGIVANARRDPDRTGRCPV